MFARFSRPVRRAAVLAAGVLSAGALALTLTAGAASAAPLHREFFTISFPAATGEAFGPVHGVFTDNETSPVSGVWTFHGPGPFPSTVRVDHSRIGNPRINPRTCSGFLFERGRWEMTGLTGADRHAFGFGRFTLSERVIVARHHGQCDPNDILAETAFVSGAGLATR